MRRRHQLEMVLHYKNGRGLKEYHSSACKVLDMRALYASKCTFHALREMRKACDEYCRRVAEHTVQYVGSKPQITFRYLEYSL